MRVFVTGGAGFIGSHVAEALLDRGDAVVAMDDFNDYYPVAFKRENAALLARRPTFRLVEGDISCRDTVRNALAAAKPDAVIHLAARAGVRASVRDPFLYQRVNVEGTLNLLDAMREFGIRKLAFGSTSSIYGFNAKVPFSEDDPVSSIVSPYAATKLAGEALCRAYHHLYGFDVAALRFFSVYGPRGRPDMAIYQFTDRISRGQAIPFFGDGSSERDYTHVDDIVTGVVAATTRRFGFEVINLGESQVTRLSDLVALLERALGKKAVLDRQPEQPGDVPRTFADISKARRLLGYDPRTSVEKGIPQFVEWFLRERAPSLAKA
ncbi:MAG: GDP-mannose 4,6-dehydratase [Verrucomicrobiae bacterium]|nr:GDP-mannose 4,6-dehydratase [Verrucomicrobiae bacterium]